MKSQNGNVLFLILIAVALFAALSYAVTQASRSGSGKGVSEDQARMIASSLMQYAVSVSTAVERIRMSGQFDYTQLDFRNPGSDNPNCTVPACEVFNTSELGVPYQAPNLPWLDADNGDVFWGEYRALPAPLVGAGSVAGDIIWELPFVKREICIEINRMAGLGAPGAEPPINQDAWVNYHTWFTGQGNWEGPVGDAAETMTGHATGCYRNYDDTFYVFYHLLLQR